MALTVTGLSQFGPSIKQYYYADQGKYFVATTPTPGSGIISGTVTAFADTTPYLVVKNNNTVQSGIKLYMDFWRIHATAIGSGGTVRNMTFKVDSSQSVTRYSSGGTTGIVPVNVNADSANASQAQVSIGAITATAAGGGRLIANVMMREVIEVVADTYTFDFGGTSAQSSATLATAAGATTSRVFSLPPVVVGPQEHFLAHFWAGSMGGGATFENVLGWVEA